MAAAPVQLAPLLQRDAHARSLAQRLGRADQPSGDIRLSDGDREASQSAQAGHDSLAARRSRTPDAQRLREIRHRPGCLTLAQRPVAQVVQGDGARKPQAALLGEALLEQGRRRGRDRPAGGRRWPGCCRGTPRSPHRRAGGGWPATAPDGRRRTTSCAPATSRNPALLSATASAQSSPSSRAMARPSASGGAGGGQIVRGARTARRRRSGRGPDRRVHPPRAGRRDASCHVRRRVALAEVAFGPAQEDQGEAEHRAVGRTPARGARSPPASGRATAYLPMYPASAPAVQSSRMRLRRGRLRRRRRQRQLAPAPALVAGGRRCASSTRSESAPTIRTSAPRHHPRQRCSTPRRCAGCPSPRRCVAASARAARDAGGRAASSTNATKKAACARRAPSASPRACSCSSPNSRTVSSIQNRGSLLGPSPLPQQVLLNERARVRSRGRGDRSPCLRASRPRWAAPRPPSPRRDRSRR